MLLLLRTLLFAVRALLRPRTALVLENLAVRQQLAVLRRTAPRPQLLRLDRVFWAFLARIWSGWRSCLLVVKPETVDRLAPSTFRLFWRRRFRQRGRPPVSAEVIALIRRMATENTGWGAPRIRSELKLLGHDVAESTVAKHMPQFRRAASPSKIWRVSVSLWVPCKPLLDQKECRDCLHFVNLTEQYHLEHFGPCTALNNDRLAVRLALEC